MECFVCGGAAEQAASTGDYLPVSCSNGCGTYRISGSVVGLLDSPDRRLDAAATRAWLDARRAAGDLRPIISTQSACWA